MVRKVRKKHVRDGGSYDPNGPAVTARAKLNQEIKAGRIVRPDICEVCGSEGQMFGHHYRGYTYPLDVWFVCVSCNSRLTSHDGSQTKEQAKRQIAGSNHKKTDNSSPQAKLELRRYFLRKYHTEPPDVLDCCQGEGVLWSELRKEFPLKSYWGLDLKPKKGRLKIDSSRVLAQRGWTQNVIDIDTYGEPWKHWVAMLPNIMRPTTAFLTFGRGAKGLARPPDAILRAMGLNKKQIELLGNSCSRIQSMLVEMAVNHALTMACDYDIITDEIVEAASVRNTRYFGVHLHPPKTNGPQLTAAGRPEHTHATRSAEHV